MGDNNKSREQLVEELSQARKRIAELEAATTTSGKVSSLYHTIFEHFVESATDSFSIWDSNLNLIYINDATLKYHPTGTRKSDVIGKNIKELIPDSDKSGRYERYKHVLETGEPIAIEDFKADPKYGDIYLSIKVFKIGDGIGIVSSDVTERRHMEQELRASQQRLSAFIENAPDIIFSYDIHGRFLSGNRRVSELMGYTKGEMIGKTFEESGIFTNESLEKGKNRLEKYKLGEKLEPTPYELIAKDGSHIFVEVRGVPIVQDDTIEIIAIARDITERKKTEESLQLSEERYRQLAEDMPALVCTFLPDSTLTYVNQAYCDYFKKSSRELIGARFLDFLPDDEERRRVKEQYESLNAENPVITYEHMVETPDGAKRWQQWTDRALFNDAGELTGYQSLGFDITERKRMEETLRHSEEKFRVIFSSIADGISVIDLTTGKIIDTNEAALRMFNFDREDVIGMNAYELVAEKDRQRAMEDLVNTLQTGDSGLAEWCLLGKGGTEHDCEARASVIRDESWNPLYLVNVMRDITERKQLYKKLQENEEKLRRVFDSIGDGLSVTDLEGNVLDVNEEALRLSGYNRDEFIGRFGLDLLVERDRPRAIQDMLECFNTGYSGLREYTSLTKNGREFPAEARATVLYDTDGKPVGLVSCLRDITERKQMEEKLKQSEERIRQVFNSVGVGITVTDTEGKVIDVNDFGLQLGGYDKEELLGSNGIRVIAEKDRPRIVTEMIEAFKTGRSSIQEFTALKNDGSEYEVEAIATVLSDDSGKPTGLIISITDISERKRIERELTDYKENLEKMVERRTRELSDAYAELKHNEAALKESEEKYRSLVEQLPQGIVIMQDNRIVFANDAMSRINGHSVTEMLSMSPEKVVNIAHPGSRNNLSKRIDERMKGILMPQHSEWRIVSKDGTERWLEAQAMRIIFNGKHAIQATLTDITERKRMENALRNSEEKLRTMFTSMADSVIVTDLEGNFRDANMAALNIFGYHSKEDVRDVNGFDFIADRDREMAMKDMARLFAEGFVTGRSWTFKHSSGREFQAELSTALLKDADGNPTDILVVMRDITERKRIEEALRESEEKLRATFEAIADGIAVADFTGKLIDMNTADIELFGYENKEQLTDRDVLNFVTEADRERVINDITSVIISGKGVAGEYRLVDRNGKEFDAEVRGSVLRNSSGEPKAIVNVIRDITERKKAEEALRESREELRFYLNQLTKAQEEERKKIARELHDDTIQELITLSRQLDDLIDKKIKPDEDRRESRVKIEAARHKVDAILKSVRQFTRDLRPSVLDDLGLGPALEWLSSDMSSRFGIPIDTSIIGKEQHVSPDASLAIFRVAQESLRNAGRHAEASQIQLNLKFTRQTATLSIIDDGKGFTPPKQTSKLTKLGKLGVAGMYERAQLIGATLSIKSKRNKGTIVSLEVPLK